MTTPFDKWKAARNQALRTLDLEYARAQMPYLSGAVILMGLHKARLHCKEIESELRRESQAWLSERGLTDALGQPVSVNDPLPS